MSCNLARILVAFSLALAACGSGLAEEFVDQPPDRLSTLSTADGLVVYDDELADLFGRLARAQEWGGLILVFTQCHSGGMLDDLAQALEGTGPVALLAACRYDEFAWMAVTSDPSGCLSGCNLTRPETYYAAVLASLLAEGVSLEKVARKAAILDPAAPGGPATDPQICPGDSLVDQPETPQWTFLGGGEKLILGRDVTGQPLLPDQLVGVLIVGEADAVAMWNDLDRYHSLLIRLGFREDNLLVLAGPGPGGTVELTDPEGEIITVPPYVDAPGNRTQILSSVEWAFDRLPPQGQLFFWFTGHGSELPAFPWSQALRLELGQTVTGELSFQDLTMPDGSKYDLYTFSLTETSQVTITLSSQDFDAFLWLFDSERLPVATDDDSGGGLDAQISVELTSGIYFIVANSFSEGEYGSYTLATIPRSSESGKVK